MRRSKIELDIQVNPSRVQRRPPSPASLLARIVVEIELLSSQMGGICTAVHEMKFGSRVRSKRETDRRKFGNKDAGRFRSVPVLAQVAASAQFPLPAHHPHSLTANLIPSRFRVSHTTKGLASFVLL